MSSLSTWQQSFSFDSELCLEIGMFLSYCFSSNITIVKSDRKISSSKEKDLEEYIGLAKKFIWVFP